MKVRHQIKTTGLIAVLILMSGSGLLLLSGCGGGNGDGSSSSPVIAIAAEQSAIYASPKGAGEPFTVAVSSSSQQSFFSTNSTTESVKNIRIVSGLPEGISAEYSVGCQDTSKGVCTITLSGNANNPVLPGTTQLLIQGDNTNQINVPLIIQYPSLNVSGLSSAIKDTDVHTVTLSNDSNTILTLGQLALSGNDWQISDDDCSGQVLGSNHSCTFGVQNDGVFGSSSILVTANELQNNMTFSLMPGVSFDASEMPESGTVQVSLQNYNTNIYKEMLPATGETPVVFTLANHSLFEIPAGAITTRFVNGNLTKSSDGVGKDVQEDNVCANGLAVNASCDITLLAGDEPSYGRSDSFQINLGSQTYTQLLTLSTNIGFSSTTTAVNLSPSGSADTVIQMTNRTNDPITVWLEKSNNDDVTTDDYEVACGNGTLTDQYKCTFEGDSSGYIVLTGKGGTPTGSYAYDLVDHDNDDITVPITVNVVNPSVTINGQSGITTPDQANQVTITNDGTVPAQVNVIGVSGNDWALTGTNTCTSTSFDNGAGAQTAVLGPGQSCTVNVINASAAYTAATLTISPDSSWYLSNPVAQITPSLNGAVRLSPTTLELAEGTPQQLTLSNDSAYNIPNGVLSVAFDSGSSFTDNNVTVDDGDCSDGVSQGGQCTVSITSPGDLTGVSGITQQLKVNDSVSGTVLDQTAVTAPSGDLTFSEDDTNRTLSYQRLKVTAGAGVSEFYFPSNSVTIGNTSLLEVQAPPGTSDPANGCYTTHGSIGTALLSGESCYIWLHARTQSQPGENATTVQVPYTLTSGVTRTGNAVSITTNQYLYAGGEFTGTNDAGGITLNRIARWNGSSWSTVGSGVDDYMVKALAVGDDGNLYVGGTFTQIAGDTDLNYLARWNGQGWSAVGAGTLDSNAGSGVAGVYALVFENGDLYVAGAIALGIDHQDDGIGKWNGSQWVKIIYLQIDQEIPFTSIAVNGNEVYFSTSTGDIAFSPLGGGSLQFDGGVAVCDMSTGTCSALGTPPDDGTDGVINSLLYDHVNDRLFVGGEFDIAGGTVSSRNVATWNGSSWSNQYQLPSGAAQVTQVYLDQSNHLYITGDFKEAFGPNKVAKWNGSDWNDLTLGQDGEAAGQVNVMLADSSGNKYFGGTFLKLDFYANAQRVAKLPYNAVEFTAFQEMGDGLNGTVHALATSSYININ